MKAKGKRQKAKDERGEGSKNDSISPFSRPASAAASRRTPMRREPLKDTLPRRAPSQPVSTRRTSSQRTSSSSALGVAVVGAGRLGTALARALAACGYEVRALVSRREGHARRAVELAGVKAMALPVARLEELPPSELLFITTPDDAVAGVTELIAALPRERVRGRVALHTSGALSSEVLAPLRASGFRVGSMHPLAAVSDGAASGESLRRAFYCIEGDGAAVAAARRVVRDLGGESFSVRAEDKALYHAAALMAAGHTVALFDIAAGLLVRCGLAPKRAQRVLLPLLRSTLENLSRTPPARALTGSFARGDADTVRKHLKALRAAGDTEALLAYALLGGRSLRLAARAGVADASALKEIARLLASVMGSEEKEGAASVAEDRMEGEG